MVDGVIYLKRGVLTYILIAILLFSYVDIAVAGQIDEKQEELKGIRGEIKDKQSEIQTIKVEQGDVSGQLAKLERDLKDNEAELEATERELTQTQEALEVTKEELRVAIEESETHREFMQERLCAMYMSTNTSYLEILFEAKGFTDFLDRIVMVREIVSLDQQVLDEMQAIEDEIQKKRLRLEDQERSIEEKQAKIIETRQTIESQKAQRETLLAKLKKQEQELEQGLALLEKESQEIEATIKRYMQEQAEKERKRKEEEKRLKAAQSAKEDQEHKGKDEQQPPKKDKPSRGDSAGGSMAWPIPGYYTITSPYGKRTHPVTGKPRTPHTGVDIAGAGINGQSAVAALGGTVILAQYNGGYGNCVIIDHGDGLSTLYAHGSSILVSNGQSVQKGQPVLKVGSTGVSTGPHLHFEVRVNGSHTNPMNYIK